jgi:hypothetical protein
VEPIIILSDRLVLRVDFSGGSHGTTLISEMYIWGVGAATIAFASPSRALTRVAPIEPVDEAPALPPEAAVATPEDMERAKIEKT